MTDDAPPSGPESSITPDKIRGRLAEDLRGAVARGEEIKLSIWARRYGLSVAEVGKILAGVRAMAAAVGERPAEVAARTDAVAAKAPPAGPPPLPADYEILGELGRGAMGVVYRARQRSMDRVVAVKVLRPGDALFANLADRFRREVKALAKLRHPHIVAVHDVGEAGGHLFFSMDLVEGRSLHDLVQAGEVTPTRAVKLMTQVASAIAYTHSHGLVHRDLKPGNILVDGKGEAFVVDFGLARDTAVDGQLTGTGQILGTPAYMAPEQAKGDAAAIGEPSDVYALGAVLYECLTKRPPFEGRSLIDTIRAVVHDEPVAPRKLDPRIPRDLEVICQTAMAKEPQRRYSSAQALQEDLERFVEGLPIRARPASAPERLRRWAARNPAIASSVGGAFVVLVAGLAVTSYLLAQTTRERNDKAAAVVDRDKALRAERAALAETTKERDAKSAALTREEASRLRFQSEALLHKDPGLAHRLAIEAAQRAPGPESDDALRRALDADRESCVLKGGHRRFSGAVFDLDASRVLTTALDDTVQVWDRATGRMLAEWDPRVGDLRRDGVATVSPDGLRVALAGKDAAIVAEFATGRELVRLENAAGSGGFAAFSPDGRRLHGASGLWDAMTGRRLLALSEEQADVPPMFSPDGSQASFVDGKSLVIVDSADGRVASTRPITAPDCWRIRLAWERGRPIAVVPTDAEGGVDVAVVDAETGTVSRSFRIAGADHGRPATLSSDGRRMVVEVSDHLCVWDTASGARIAEILDSDDEINPEFSPDGRWLITRNRTDCETKFEHLRLWDAESGAAVAEFHGTFGDVFTTSFSADSAFLATTWQDAETAKVWSISAARPVPLLSGGLGPSSSAVFTADASRVLLRGGVDRRQEPDASAAEGAATLHDVASGRQVTRFDSGRVALSADGRTLGHLDGNVIVVHSCADGRAAVRIESTAEAASLEFDATGTQLAAALADGSVRIWKVADGREAVTVRIDGEALSSAQFAPRGHLAFAIGTKGAVVFDARNGEVVSRLVPKDGVVVRTWFTPSGDHVLAKIRTRPGAPIYTSAFSLWDARTGRMAWEALGSSYSDTPVFPSPGWRHLAAGHGKEVELVDAESGRHVRALVADYHPSIGTGDKSTLVAFSPDSKQIAVGPPGRDGGVWLWDLAASDPRMVLAPEEAMRCIEFSPLGMRLLSVADSGTVRVWDAESGTPIATIDGTFARRAGGGRHARLATFSPDGRRVLVAYEDGTCRIWPLDPLPEAVATCSRQLTAVERLLYLESVDEQVIRRAQEAVSNVSREELLRDELLTALRAAPTLDENVRTAALAIAAEHEPYPDSLDARARKLVADRAAGGDAFSRGLRLADEVVRLVPLHGYARTTLGIAQYRTGDTVSSVATLARASEMNGGESPADLAFLAMSLERLGRSDEARATFAKLRESMKDNDRAKNAESQGFLREVEETLGGPR